MLLLLWLACAPSPSTKESTTAIVCSEGSPQAAELCNGLDDNCDGLIDNNAVDSQLFYADTDGDAYGDPALPLVGCTAPTGYVADRSDCDPTNTSIHPGATELCNGTDDNCDGVIDEADAADAPLWFADTDGDTYGDPESASPSCTPPDGFVADASDCDDRDPTRHPDAGERCDPDDVDEDCDGLSDDADTGPSAPSTWYADADGDGHGDPDSPQQACDRPDGFVSSTTDCHDGNFLIHPDMAETCNGLDDNCDGLIDEEALDALPWYADVDGDGFGDSSTLVLACVAPPSFSAVAGDCNDSDVTLSPAAAERCDGAAVDEDCDGLTEDADPSVDPSSFTTGYRDLDSDGYGDGSSPLAACTLPTGYSLDATDCNDNSSSISPGSSERCDAANTDENCDGVADDSDPSVDTTTTTLWYLDNDADGYAGASSQRTCDQPSGSLSSSSDCDDGNSAIYPGHSEVCNGTDDDCDGSLDPSSASSCPDPSALSLTEGNGLYPISAASYVLADEDGWAAADAILDSLDPRLNNVSVGDVLADVNRDGDPISSGDLPRATGFERGFVWNSGDVAVDYWIPQGITGTFDADPSGVVDGYEAVLVAWHYDTSAGGTSYDKGVRVSFADISSTTDIDYRHVLLVKPTGTASSPSFEAVGVHAGGIAWVGDYLYVADTSNGLRVFDMSRMLEVATDQDSIGCDSSGTCRAYQYKYILPQVTRYALPDCGCDLTFSFVSYDSSTNSLITGAYSSNSIDGVLVRWPLDGTTQLPAPYTTATEAWVAQQDRMQGAAAYNGEFWLSCSSQSGAYGKLYNLSTAGSTGYTWVDGPEDLAVDPLNGWLWSLTEDVGDRWVFAVDQSNVGG